MPPPENRMEFEHNVYLTIENTYKHLESGDPGRIANLQWSTLPHLQKVRKLPNTRIDMTTVNQQLRLQSNTFHWMTLTDKIGKPRQASDSPPQKEKIKTVRKGKKVVISKRKSRKKN